MDRDGTDYFRRRANEELAAVEAATSEEAAAAHRTLADRYLMMANGLHTSESQHLPSSRRLHIVA